MATRRRTTRALAVATALLLGGCTDGGDAPQVRSEGPAATGSVDPSPVDAPTPSSSSAPAVPDPSSTAPTTPPPTTVAPTSAPEEVTPSATPASGTIRDLLGVLAVDDAPRPGAPYDRDQWPHWEDLDGDGCDARQEALRASSITPAQVDPYGCRVLTGDWRSAYDGVTATDPSSFDVDHVVPLEEAHTSGGWAWSGQVRVGFANDPTNLWPVSASSNRQKGSRGPDQWRPSLEDSWCEYATRWVQVKASYRLTVTTSEREALGQMLERCATLPSIDGAASTPPTTATAPTTTPPVAPAPATAEPGAAPVNGGAGASYANCSEARAAGAAPLLRGEPGYAPRLDRDGDGIACE